MTRVTLTDRPPVAGMRPTPAYDVLARHLGAATVQADLRACLDGIDAVVRAGPLVIPPALSGVLSGGKRLRPLLVLATAHAAARPPAPDIRERAVGGARAVELLHLASLVHDDIMDEAATRHGVATISARAGNSRALLAGDYLIGHAHTAAAGLGAEAGALLGRTLVRLCEGQAEESSALFDPDRGERSYFRAISGKTGALIEAACRTGALAAGLDATTTAALGRFGHHLGIGFQLADDLLDLTGSHAAAGKPVGHDIAAGVYTHPTLWALRRDRCLRLLLAELARCEGSRAALAEEAAHRVRASGALGATRQAIARRRARCLASLDRAVDGLGPGGVGMMADLALAVLGPPGGG
ncbi:polyprenyl synthetase family protein [Streptomyces aidingensis]|uniref:Heptaprenyl diphosphate synthase n=1 Tax=Streptomyces aidingensis TaxID=910347 RepID=A0A1I1K999_9ACTN|nr:polyprenyl synthetase family protein [Streptomyces aidingensis]SFC54110.1 heptaprenyl diphosphate synthase [Streptomyces aidingensis]